MKRVQGVGLLFAVSSLPLLAAAKNSQAFDQPFDVRVGEVQMPQGHRGVTWTDASGSKVQLTIKTEDKKTITVPARVIQGGGKPAEIFAMTVRVNGVFCL